MDFGRRSLRQQLLLFTACGLVATVIPGGAGAADQSSQVNLGGIQLAQQNLPVTSSGNNAGIPSANAGKSIEPNVSANAPQNIVVRAQRLLLKERNSPSAVTELGAKQIATAGVSASTGSILRQAPSIYVYQQGIGDNAPELTVRGVRGLEVATTLDGVPTQDLLAPGAFYLADNLGGPFTINQINGVHIYPGVAYPDKSTFGTIGGTIAYDSKRPTNDEYMDVTGSVGSFGTYKEGFEFNSGRIDGPLGTGDNALKLLLNYYNLQTQGFIDGTPNRENEMEFAFDKPYSDGLSDLQGTVIYNTANGLIENEPVPIPYLQRNGLFSNYPTNLDFAQQRNSFLTTILKDDTYVNDYLQVGVTGFYLNNDQQLENYGDINLFTPGGINSPLGVGGANPFINNPAGFGYGGRYGPPVGGLSTTPPYSIPGVPLGLYNGGYGGYFYGTGHRYNPYPLYPVGSRYCPQSVVTNFENNVGPGTYPCGVNDQITGGHSDTYGLQPRVQVIVPEIFGIANTIKVGALIAKETSPSGYGYLGGAPQSISPQNEFPDAVSGGTEREIYQGYVQDKIDLIDNTLHVTPGFTLEGTHSSLISGDEFRSLSSPYYQPGGRGYFNDDGTRGTNINRYGYYKATKWDREALPFVNVTYDFDKILPPLRGLQAYGSFGNSALFAPVGDFGPNTAGPPPYASIVHMYEGGVKYNTSKISLNFDYFYQKVDRDFGFYSSQTGTTAGQSVYSNDGEREFKGVEASAQYQLTPEVQLFGNMSHLLAKYLKNSFSFDTVSQDQYGVAIKGTPISGIPDWLSTFGVDYTKKSLALDDDALDVRLTGQYTGHQYTTYDIQGPGAFGIPGVPGVDYSDPLNVFDTFTGATVTDPHGGISPFAIFSLDVNYKMPTPQLPVLKSITFDLNVQNLFDARYYQYYYKQVSPAACAVTPTNPTGNPYGCSPQFADAIPGQPASIFFTVTARF